MRRIRGSLEGPNSHDHRVFVLAGHDDRLQSQGIQTGQADQLIDGFLQDRPGIRIVNEKPPVLNLDIMVENGVGRGVHVGDKTVPVSAIAGRRIALSAAIGKGSTRALP